MLGNDTIIERVGALPTTPRRRFEALKVTSSSSFFKGEFELANIFVARYLAVSDATSFRVACRAIRECLDAQAASPTNSNGSHSSLDNAMVLGRGTFGTVYQVTSCLAVKVLPATLDAYVEIDILQSLHHPGALGVYDFWERDSYLYIVMELLICDLGNVAKPCAEPRVRHVMQQVCDAMAYCHNQGVMHKDLKLSNIMLASADPPKAVIIDWGIAERGGFSTRWGGTLEIMAPEVIGQQFTSKCDVWSLGCVMFALLCQRPFRVPTPWYYPFPLPEDGAMHIAQLERGAQCGRLCASAKAKQLVRKMLTFDDAKRPSMQDVLADDFFSVPAVGVQVSRCFVVVLLLVVCLIGLCFSGFLHGRLANFDNPMARIAHSCKQHILLRPPPWKRSFPGRVVI
ncbi:CPK2 [Symbiodinium sp. CCMP2592]|nr:CPK2 [Symbiodinium sp. CCMP2592]